MMKHIYCLIFLLILGNVAYCQNNNSSALPDTTDLSNLSIEELSKLKSRYTSTDMEKIISQAIDAASRKPLTLRKSPSIISVITEDEIEKSGARDLMDVFKLIPGIEFNVDVEGVVAISFRGMWANEGTLSMQMDGLEINETAYGSLQFGNHYNVNQIKKIEVIRGPGSALYGGYAEYAVINIITKKGADIKGISADALLGQTANTYAQQDINIAIGNKVNDLSYSLLGLIGRGQRSNLQYTDVYNTPFNMANNSNLNPEVLNLNFAYKALSVSFLYDNYTTTTRDAYITALSKPYPCNFLNYMSEIKYSKQISKKIELITKFKYKHSEPWTFDGYPLPIDSSYGYYKIYTNRYSLDLVASWNPTKSINMNFGVESYLDDAFKPNGQIFRANNSTMVQYFNYAPFAQILFKTSFANFTIGARYDLSSAFGHDFNPRFGITKKVGNLNFKLLFAESFRAPSIENIQYSLDGIKLKPEESQTIEFETSLKITKDMFISANIFDITTTNAIRYFVKTDSVVSGDPDGYKNSNKVIGSQGVEIEYKYKSALGFINIAYSYYTIGRKNIDSTSMVSINKDAALGIAQNKLTILASINSGKYFYITPSINIIGKRYGYSAVDSFGKGIITQYKPQTQLNIYAGCKNLFKNISGGIGINNITDEHIIYLQAYNSLHAPLPGLGREFYIKMNYNFPFKQKQGNNK